MIKFFKDNKLKQELINGINILLQADSKFLGIYSKDYDLDLTENEKIVQYLESIKCLGEIYSKEELEDLLFEDDGEEIIINKQGELEIYLDEAESKIECTIDEFIELISEVESCSINEDGICISKKSVILRVFTNDEFDNDGFEESIDTLLELDKEISYKDKNVELRINTFNNLYALKIFVDNEFDEFNPVICSDDLFIEIIFDDSESIKLDEVKEIYNIYIFEVFRQFKIKLELNPRYTYKIEEGEIEEESEGNRELSIDSRLFTKGMKDIISIFNKAEGYNNDRAIVEYVKVIEYVSATVIRQEVTIKARQKLEVLDISAISGDYIKELGNIFLNSNQKYRTDSEMIKTTIKTCCDIESVSIYAPSFMNELKNLNNKISQEPSNKEMLCNQAYGELAASISNTRNNLSHAKANYDKKGLECPDTQKDEFVILLRNVTLQVIEWFCNSDESIRIINE